MLTVATYWVNQTKKGGVRPFLFELFVWKNISQLTALGKVQTRKKFQPVYCLYQLHDRLKNQSNNDGINDQRQFLSKLYGSKFNGAE
jgi:hypothetical protein